jgi:hypothetical protein
MSTVLNKPIEHLEKQIKQDLESAEYYHKNFKFYEQQAVEKMEMLEGLKEARKYL